MMIQFFTLLSFLTIIIGIFASKNDQIFRPFHKPNGRSTKCTSISNGTILLSEDHLDARAGANSTHTTVVPCEDNEIPKAKGYLSLRAFIQRPQSGSQSKNNVNTPEAINDCYGGNDLVEIDINSHLGPNKTWEIDNDFFQGELCVLIRDHPHCYYDFDNEKDVYFELQFQGKFKRKPRGPLYMGFEVPQKSEFKVSWPVRTILSAAIAFIKSWGYKWVHMSYGGGKGGDTPHISSPAFQAFDRIVITPDGLTPPPLGYVIPECGEDIHRRKNFQFNHKIDTCCTYTMSFNHTFVDVVKWKVNGIPVVKSFDLFVKDIRLSVYEIDVGDDVDTGGDVQAIASMKVHRKRETAMWVHFRNSQDNNS